MTDRLPPYSGSFPEEQEAADFAVRQLVERADGRLVSRQALAVLRVLVDQICRLEDRVCGLEAEVDESRMKEGA